MYVREARSGGHGEERSSNPESAAGMNAVSNAADARCRRFGQRMCAAVGEGADYRLGLPVNGSGMQFGLRARAAAHSGTPAGGYVKRRAFWSGGPEAAGLHAVAEQGVPFREIAQAIAKALDLPVKPDHVSCRDRCRDQDVG